MRLLTSLLLALFISTHALAQEEEEVSMVSTKRLTLFTAVKIAQAAIAECTKKGIQIGVTVVDREGIVQATLRDTIAAQITVPISQDKAYTAANFNSATSAMADRAGTPIGRQPRLIMSAGASRTSYQRSHPSFIRVLLRIS